MGQSGEDLRCDSQQAQRIQLREGEGQDRARTILIIVICIIFPYVVVSN